MKSGYVKPKGIKVTTTGDSRVISSNNATVSHKSSSSSRSNPNNITTSSSPTTANAAKSSSSIGSPQESGGEVSTTLSSSSSDSPSNREITGSPEIQSVRGDGSGGRGALGDTASGFASLSTGERFATMGEALNADWEYYKPVASLALWESGAAQQVINGARNVISNIVGKYTSKSSGKVINWAQDEIQRTGMPAVTEKAGKVVPASNSKTNSLLLKNLKKAGFHITTAALLSILPGKVFSEFQLVEGMDKLGYVRTRAIEAGDLESVAEIDLMMDDLGNQTKLQEFKSFVPFLGGLVGTKQNQEAAILANNIYKRLGEYKASGVSSAEDYDVSRQQKIADEIASVDYYNDQRKIASENARIAEINARNEDAAFWKKHQKELDKMEAAQTERIADFWMEYAKKKAEYEEDSQSSYTPTDEAPFSKLGFGLL